MTSFQKSGALHVGHVEKNFMPQPRNTWKATSGYIPIQTIALEDGNE